MKDKSRAAWIVGCLLIVGVVRPYTLSGAEPAVEFLKSLREHDYHDVAMLYLDRLAKMGEVPAELAQVLDYERALTLVQAALRERDLGARRNKLQSAQSYFKRFIDAHAAHPQSVAARRQLGQVLSAWSRLELEQANKHDNPAGRTQAAKLAAQAHTAFLAAQAHLKDELLKLRAAAGTGSATADNLKQRIQLQNDYLDVQVLAGRALEDQAAATTGAADKKNLLKQAADWYGEIFDKYSKLDLLGAYQARMYQARVRIALGDRAAALKILKDDLLTLESDKAVVRRLITPALLLAISCWEQDPQDGKNYEQALRRGHAWLATVRPVEAEEQDWLQLQIDLARIHGEYAQLLKQRDPRDVKAKEHLEQAARLARSVARVAGPLQTDAQTLLAGLPGTALSASSPPRETPTTFADARNAGQESLSNMRSAQFIVKHVPARLAKEKDPKQKAELRKTIDDAKQAIQMRQSEAEKYYLLALELADRDTPLEDLYYVYYSLGYLRYLSGEYYDAAVYSEFLARRFPDATLAPKAAEITLAAYLKLYAAAPDGAKQASADHVVATAGYIVDTWAGKPVAITALNTMIPFLIRQGKLSVAREYLGRIPSETRERGAAELRVGQAMWDSYVRAIEALRAAEHPPDGTAAKADAAQLQAQKLELEKLKQTAVTVLQSGVQRMRQRDARDPNLPRAVIVLAQMLVDSDQAQQALQLLDDDKIGPLTLLDRGAKSGMDPLLIEQTYRVALGALVGALPKAGDTEQRAALVQRARSMMQQLRAQIGDKPEDQKRLVATFFSLARGLERQLTLLDNADDRRVLSNGFAVFLNEVYNEAKDHRVLNWVAQSYVGLGNGLRGDPDAKTLARQYYDRAVGVYDELLKNGSLDAQVLRQLHINKAQALREAGRYATAMTLLGKALREKNNDVTVQIEAARTLQQRGQLPGQSEYLLTATRGTLPDGAKRNTIWGWNSIARKTQSFAKFRAQFHEARYHMAQCYFQYAMRQRDTPTKAKYLDLAKRTIVSTQQLYPVLGGDAQRAEYDALLRQIQNALKEKPTGLEENKPVSRSAS